MRSSVLNIAASILAFICGIVTALPWNSARRIVRVYQPPTVEECRSVIPYPEPSAAPTPRPSRVILIGEDRLKVVSDQMRLKSERLRYEIDVHYPQIMRTEDAQLLKLNQHIKQLASSYHQSLLNPTQADLKRYEKWAGVSNSVKVDYEYSLTTDSLLSIYFYGYRYDVGAAHAVQQSFTVNYDLAFRKELKLADVFKRNSNYLEFISSYCIAVLSQLALPNMSSGALKQKPENFESWKITRNGIAFTFDSCRIFACSVGQQTVEIPFASLRGLLSSNSSVKALSE